MQDPNEVREDMEFHRADGRTPDGAPVKPASKARQGVTSGRVLMVLSFGLALVIIGFAVSYVGAV